jgi:hypothetical protein
VIRAHADTARSSLDLLNLPYPFSQVDLMTPEQLEAAAKARRICMAYGRALDLPGLEELHRHGILVPLFCVTLEPPSPRRRLDVAGSLTLRHVNTTHVNQLFLAAADGRLTDPAADTFRPWSTKRVRALWPTMERGYLYSQHQLLGLARARHIVGAIRPAESPAGGRRTWQLNPTAYPDVETLAALSSWRSLAITLSALDTRYWPRLTQLIWHEASAWRSSRLTMDAPALLSWLGVDVDALRAQEERLLVDAHFRDVLGDFYEIVRRAKPKAWDTLQGDARLALDNRLSAEVLAQFADELGAPHLVRQNLSMQRLTDREESLDATLSALQLSPHPQLVIGVEGDTELLIVPRVMKLLGFDTEDRMIRIVNFGGTTKDLTLLAKYAAQPVLGTDHGDSVCLDRPFTRFLVMTDAEEKYATAEKRRTQRKNLIDAIASALPSDLRRDLYMRGTRTVEITTWGPRAPWEFAHFTNTELADALLTRAGEDRRKGRDSLIRAIGLQRDKDATPNIDDAWKSSGVSKPDLAEQLWPTLERKIEAAIRRGTRGPPVMKAVVRAWDLATLSHRQTIWLRRYPTRNRRGRP